MPTVQREIERAEAAGIVRTRKVGPTRLVRANPAHPLQDAVRQLILATYGPPAIVAEEFDEIDAAEAVLLFGSWAARYRGEPGRAPNDIDVLVIGNPDRDAVDNAAERAERRIGLPVQATVRSRGRWDARQESFIKDPLSAHDPSSSPATTIRCSLICVTPTPPTPRMRPHVELGAWPQRP